MIRSAVLFAILAGASAATWSVCLKLGAARINVALAAMPGVVMPGDTSASARYFAEDLTDPFVVDQDGTMAVPAGPGIGVAPDPGRLAACTVRREVVAAGA